MLAAQIAIIIGLILLNGLLAMSELAVVSARPARLRARQQEGQRGAGRALALASDPGRFLSTVQIGITLVGVLSGAFSGSTLGLRLAGVLEEAGLTPSLANTLGVGSVVAVITYFSLIIGELVPKQIALRNPERVAMLVAPIMTVLATVAAPIVWLLDVSGRTVLIVLGQSGQSEGRVTDDEITTLIAEAEHQGTIETDERRMIAGVMRLGDRAVRSIMTPRNDVDWLNLDADRKTIRKQLIETRHSRLPAAEGSVDHMVGVVHTREVLAALLTRKAFDPRQFVIKVPVVHDNADALDVLTMLRNADIPMALVHDEYGVFEGLVTPADVLETIAGAFKADLDAEGPPAVQRGDGSWLIAGYMSADDMADVLGFALPVRRDYETVAGFLLSYLHHLPVAGETVDAHGWRFEIVDMDGRRIDKIIASRLPPTHRERPAE
jgi:putative hemolysin